MLEGSAKFLLTRGKLLLVGVKIDLLLRQLAFLRRQLLSGKPLLLSDFSLLEEEGLLRFGKLLPLLRQGPESFLVEAPELLRVLLDSTPAFTTSASRDSSLACRAR